MMPGMRPQLGDDVRFLCASNAVRRRHYKGAATQLRPLARHPSQSQSSPYRRRVVLLRSNVS